LNDLLIQSSTARSQTEKNKSKERSHESLHYLELCQAFGGDMSESLPKVRGIGLTR